MARIHIELPEHFALSTDIALYRSHMNCGKRYCNNGVALAFAPQGATLPAVRT